MILSNPAARRLGLFIAVCAAALLLQSCATQPVPTASGPPGFLPNSGGWYDFGYLLGAMSFLGGGGASARK